MAGLSTVLQGMSVDPETQDWVYRNVLPKSDTYDAIPAHIPSTDPVEERGRAPTARERADAFRADQRQQSMSRFLQDVDRPHSWGGALHTLAMALSGIRGGALETGGMGDVTPGALHLPGREPWEQPFDLAHSETNFAQAPSSLAGVRLGEVTPLARVSPYWDAKLAAGQARRRDPNYIPVAGVDFPEKQYYELPFGLGMLPNPARLTWEDIKGVQPLMMTGYYTGLPGTIRSSLMEQWPAKLAQWLPKIFAGKGSSKVEELPQRSPGELGPHAHDHP